MKVNFFMPGMVVHSYNPSSRAVEAGRENAGGQLG
jgi:hypothetical protein